MRFRRGAAGLIGGGMLLMTAATAVPAGAAPYPPASCGASGAGTVSTTAALAGAIITFGGGGFIAFTPLTITVNGIAFGTVRADSTGAFTIPLRLLTPGVKVIVATGLTIIDTGTGGGDAGTGSGGGAGTGSGSGDGTAPCVANGAATSHGSVEAAPYVSGGAVAPAALVTIVRRVTATITVYGVKDEAATTTGAAASGGGLPFTGAETGALVAVAVVLVGGGLALRIGSRRRRAAA